VTLAAGHCNKSHKTATVSGIIISIVFFASSGVMVTEIFLNSVSKFGQSVLVAQFIVINSSKNSIVHAVLLE
jgi:hypothetical protein